MVDVVAVAPQLDRPAAFEERGAAVACAQRMVGLVAQCRAVALERTGKGREQSLDDGILLRDEAARRLTAVAQALIEGMRREAVTRTERLDECRVELLDRAPAGWRLELVHPYQAVIVVQPRVDGIPEQARRRRFV